MGAVWEHVLAQRRQIGVCASASSTFACVPNQFPPVPLAPSATVRCAPHACGVASAPSASCLPAFAPAINSASPQERHRAETSELYTLFPTRGRPGQCQMPRCQNGAQVPSGRLAAFLAEVSRAAREGAIRQRSVRRFRLRGGGASAGSFHAAEAVLAPSPKAS